jgi:diadenosine tetraphosphate (Ap4A) HIT family hydrolase
VEVSDALHPVFYRVIWESHVPEMTDLTREDRQLLMDAVFAVESAIRRVESPTKINLASLGNLTPHVHWHVIARFSDDPHFPAPIWATAQREHAHLLSRASALEIQTLVREALADPSL